MTRSLPAAIPFLTSLGVCVFFAAMFAVPSGYSYGGAILLIAGLWMMARRAGPDLTRHDRVMIYVLAAYFAIPSAMTLALDNNVTDIDQYSRALLAIPILLLVLRVPVPPARMWATIAVGVILSAPLAWWQVEIQGLPRAEGYLNAIHFSNISLVFAAFCAGGLFWAANRPRGRNLWRAAFLLGMACGLYAMIMGGARSSWVAIPPLVAVFLLSFLTRRNIGRLCLGLFAGAVVFTIVFSIPDSPLRERYDIAVQDITRYQKDHRHSSIGDRLEMWRGAWNNLTEEALTGWNVKAYTKALREQIQEDDLSRFTLRYNDNLHNNYLQAWVFTGVPGLCALLALYGWPLWHFGRRLRLENLDARIWAFCGTSTVVAYLCFSLTQVILRRNNGIMFYLLAIAILWGALRQAQENRRSDTETAASRI